MSRSTMRRHSWEDPVLRPGTYVRWNGFEGLYLGGRFWLMVDPLMVVWNVHIHDCVSRAIRKGKRVRAF